MHKQRKRRKIHCRLKHPDLNIGDSWSFVRLAYLTNIQTGEFTATVASVEDTKIRLATGVPGGKTKDVLPTKRGDYGQTPQERSIRQNKHIRSRWLLVRNGNTAPCFHLPAAVLHALISLQKSSNGESVTVPAGTFRALRIDHDGRWTNCHGSDTHKETYWYVPALRTSVKSETVWGNHQGTRWLYTCFIERRIEINLQGFRVPPLATVLCLGKMLGMSKVIVFATPVFFLLIAIEWAWAHRSNARVGVQRAYRLNDAINSISLGIISQLGGVLSKALTVGIYTAVFHSVALLPDLALWNTWQGYVIALLFYDLCYYWLHRAGHEVAVLWAAHVVHHQSQHYNLSTALRQTTSGALFGWIFYLPMAVAGVPPLVFGIVALIDLLYQFWVHTEQVGKLGWFDRVFCSPSNHRVHHAVNDPYIDRNYGGLLVVWGPDVRHLSG